MHGSRTATIRIRPKLGALAVCLADRPAARRWLSLVWLAALPLGLVGCWRAPESEVVAYTALDQEFSGPIYARFTHITGIEVAAKYDVESTKTLGLVEAIVAERQRPRADLFWNNEILHTLRLERAGLLAAFTPPNAASFPAQFRSTAGRWYGMAARARVLLVNTDRIGHSERPQSIYDLADVRWRGQAALAKPLFGTTATHAACLFQVLGEQAARQLFREWRANARILSGNKQVAQAVASGEIAFGLTDTDDALAECERGQPVEIVYPDQQPDGLGTLYIPNTIAILQGCPHPQQARQLADFLLSAEVESELSRGPSGQVPLHADAPGTGRIRSPSELRTMQVDFAAAGARWEEVARFLGDEFSAP